MNSGSTTNSYIDNKINSQQPAPSPDYTMFYTQIFYIIINVIVSIFVGCIFLYICKLSQSDVLLNTIKFINKENIDSIGINKEKIVDVNIVKQYAGFFGKFGIGFLTSSKPEIYTTKVVFNDSLDEIKEKFKILDRMKDKIDGKGITSEKYEELKKLANPKVDDVKKMKEPVNNTTTTFILWYIYNIIKSSLSSSLWGVNSLFGLLGNYMTESILLLIFSLFGMSSFIFLYLFIFIITCFYALINIPRIYDSRIPAIKENDNIIKNAEFMFDMRNFIYIFTLPNVFLFLLMFFGIIFAFFISIFNCFYLLYLCLSNTGKIITPDKSISNNKSFNFTEFLKSTLKYKSQIIMLLFSYNLYNDVIQNLGTTYIVSFMIAILIFLLFTSVFQSYHLNPENNANMTPGFADNGNTKPTVVNEQVLPEPTVENKPVVPEPTLEKEPIVPEPTLVSEPVVTEPTLVSEPVVPEPTVVSESDNSPINEKNTKGGRRIKKNINPHIIKNKNDYY